MKKYERISKGLAVMFWAQVIAAILDVVMTIWKNIGLFDVTPMNDVIQLVGLTLCAVVNVIGLLVLARDIDGCKKAVILLVIKNALEYLGDELVLIKLASIVFSLMFTYCVIFSISKVFTDIDYPGVAAIGKNAWDYKIISLIFAVVGVFLLVDVPIAGLIVLFVVVVLTCIHYIFYLRFLYLGYKVMNQHVSDAKDVVE